MRMSLPSMSMPTSDMPSSRNASGLCGDTGRKDEGGGERSSRESVWVYASVARRGEWGGVGNHVQCRPNELECWVQVGRETPYEADLRDPHVEPFVDGSPVNAELIGQSLLLPAAAHAQQRDLAPLELRGVAAPAEAGRRLHAKPVAETPRLFRSTHASAVRGGCYRPGKRALD
jgi:hypothetical protein